MTKLKLFEEYEKICLGDLMERIVALANFFDTISAKITTNIRLELYNLKSVIFFLKSAFSQISQFFSDAEL